MFIISYIDFDGVGKFTRVSEELLEATMAALKAAKVTNIVIFSKLYFL